MTTEREQGVICSRLWKLVESHVWGCEATVCVCGLKYNGNMGRENIVANQEYKSGVGDVMDMWC